MGGCYTDYSSSATQRRTIVRKPRINRQPRWREELKTFSLGLETPRLLNASKLFYRTRSKGFIPELAKTMGVTSIEDIPKEFPEIEYEIKFNVEPIGKGQEPSVVEYLDAFDFPIGGNTRFIKDPVNNFAVGINHFYGDDRDERLVVIEKAGKTYLKEKGLVTPLRLGVPFEQIVVKRTENRYASGVEQVLEKVQKTTEEEGVIYRGRIRKEKGDAFLLDTRDGRIYSFTITRAHLTKPGETKESGIQRQLEIEYAGYIPTFKGFQKNSERQLVSGMVDLAKYTYSMYNGAPIANGWNMNLAITSQRKYDFVNGRPESSKNVLEMLTRPKLLSV